MPTILDLPDELLLEITRYLRSEVILHFQDLKNLSLVSRRLGRIAQEVLYHSPRLGHELFDPIEPSDRVHKLLRTLLSRSDLAKAIHGLAIVLFNWEDGEDGEDGEDEPTPNCPHESEDCGCAWGKLLQLGLHHIRDQPYVNEPWVEALKEDSPPSWASLILTVLPNLRHLSIRSYISGRIWPVSHCHLDPERWCGKPDFPMSSLSAFSKLTTMHTNGLLPWSIITLPTIKTIRFGLYSHDDVKVPDGIKIPASATLDSLQDLIVDTDLGVLQHRDKLYEGLYGYFSELLRHIIKIDYLEVNIQWQGGYEPSEVDFDFGGGKYANLTNLIRHDDLRTLIIIGPDLTPSELCWDGDYYSDSGVLFPPIEPCEVLLDLPKLQYLEAPQDLFFSVGPKLATFCKLPNTLEQLAITHATVAVHRWLLCLTIDNQNIAPGLEQISTYGNHTWDTRLDLKGCISFRANKEELEIKYAWMDDWLKHPDAEDLQTLLKEVGITWTWGASDLDED